MGDVGLVATGYGLTGLALGAYVAALIVRARRARRRSSVVAARRGI